MSEHVWIAVCIGGTIGLLAWAAWRWPHHRRAILGVISTLAGGTILAALYHRWTSDRPPSTPQEPDHDPPSPPGPPPYEGPQDYTDGLPDRERDSAPSVEDERAAEDANRLYEAQFRD